MVQAGDDGAMTRRVQGRWEKLLAFGCISDAAPIGFADRLEIAVRKGEVKDSPRTWPEQLEQSCPLWDGDIHECCRLFLRRLRAQSC